MQLVGTRVYLRPIGPEDTENALRWRSDPAVMNQLFSERPPTREEHETWLARLEASTDRQEFVIVVREGECPVGTVGLSRIERDAGRAEYGILLGAAEWRGKGLAWETSRLIIDHAFGPLGLKSLNLRLFADNQIALRLYSRLGFEAAATGAESLRTRPIMTMNLRVEAWRLRE